MSRLRLALPILIAAILGLALLLWTQKRSALDQSPSLAEQQSALVQQTQASGGDLGAAMTKFQVEHAAELAAQDAAEAGRMDVPSAEREALRERAGTRVQRIREIQAELKAGKDPAEIVPPLE